MISRTEEYFLNLFDAPTVHRAAERAAEHVRATAGYNADELPVHVFKLAQLKGFKIKYDLSGANCPEGLLVPCKGGYLVRLKSGVTSARKRFSLAHEIGHTFFYRDEGEGPRHTIGIMDRSEHEAEERICNHFAAYLLMPTRQIESHLAQVREGQPSMMLTNIELARSQFFVSLQALVVHINRSSLRTPPYMVVCSSYRSNGSTSEPPVLRVDWSVAIGEWQGRRGLWKDCRLVAANLLSAAELYDTWITTAQRGKFMLDRDKNLVPISANPFVSDEEVRMSAKSEGKWTEMTENCATASYLYTGLTCDRVTTPYILSVLAPRS